VVAQITHRRNHFVRYLFLETGEITLNQKHSLRNFRTVGALSKNLIYRPAEFREESSLQVLGACRRHENK
jgi:hypothetical protein